MSEGAGVAIPYADLELCRIDLGVANDFIMRYHRHLGKVQGYRFALGAQSNSAADEWRLAGVIVCGRPVGGQHQHDWIEVTRCCTDGTRNVCSFLYGAAARASTALGFTRIQTFILDQEHGISLRAVGWTFERMSHPTGWHHDAPRQARVVPLHLMGRKQLWFRDLKNSEPIVSRDDPDHQEDSQAQLDL